MAKTLGAEIEKSLSNRETGKSFSVDNNFFESVSAQIQAKGAKSHFDYSDIEPGVILGVGDDLVGHVGLDNGFNNQETSTRVVKTETIEEGLRELEQVLRLDLQIVQTSLREKGGTVINMANHPLGKTDEQTYRKFVAPKSVYSLITNRGWDHSAGIGANAQNSPSTGVEVYSAAKAVTTIIGISPALIGLFGNSPYAEGKETGVKEHRLMMWGRMMCGSISEGDRQTARFPEKPFETLRDYFAWMHGEGTNIMFVVAGDNGSNYKTFGDKAVLIDGNPPVIDYLRSESYRGRYFATGQPTIVNTDLSHMETLQFMQFTDARIRYGMNHKQVTREGFLKAYDTNLLEQYLADNQTTMWIEGRAPGANFPDKSLTEVSPEVAASTLIAPSAIQAGIIANLNKAYALVQRIGWGRLAQLREVAVKNGLDGEVDGVTVKKYARQVIDIATEGLPSAVHSMLAYPEYVLQIGKNGADRAIEYVENRRTHGESLHVALVSLVHSRGVLTI